VKPRIVIVGAGFAGLEAARRIDDTAASNTVIDRHNHHLFQPLLYQVATAGLSPADISVPIRSVLRRKPSTEVWLAEVTGVDTKHSHVLTSHGALPYDYLILATGSRFHYFGKPEWQAFAPGLKSIPDAIEIRRRILLAFEAAEIEPDEKKRAAHLTFLLVGGGPTGVEMAGSIAELAHKALKEDFRHIRPRSARILLVEGGPRVLGTFPESLSAKARKTLQALGVEVREKSQVQEITAEGARVGGDWIAAKTVLWTAGVTSTPIAAWLGAEADRGGRVKVNGDLTVPNHPNVFVLGDAAGALGPDGKPLPGVAPVAKQQGRYAAKVLNARLKGAPAPGPFRYVDKGNLATIGRTSAIADIRGLKLWGFPAWLIWVVVHVYYLIGFQNRLLVLMQWAWSYFTFQKGARLITPKEE
jgi:NADH:ubiquinone reductase (H+-translocating)